MDAEPFEALGLPPTFDLDPAQVDRAYLARAAALHPDLAGEGDEVLARSAALNRAREVMKDPEKRAEALLRKMGGPDKSQDKSLPDGFLMEMMEIRESIEAATAGRDPEQRARWSRWAGERRQGHIERVASMFRAAGPSPSDGAMREIRRELNAWRYAERLIEQLDPEYDPARTDFA
ncbi:MAG: DnaJ domain-containing protein [Phycisphaerales bacterium]|nr:DnaJ domain-containing protein [Phycisphaerales bacterium]